MCLLTSVGKELLPDSLHREVKLVPFKMSCTLGTRISLRYIEPSGKVCRRNGSHRCGTVQIRGEKNQGHAE